MGQYYTPIILGDFAHLRITKSEFIRLWLSSFFYSNGLKLMEHSYINNKFVSAFEYLISPDGIFHMSRVVWAGDYADNEPDSELNLNQMASEIDRKMEKTDKTHDVSCYRYIVNHTKKIYVDKSALTTNIHPLPLLISEGNGRGGGDYSGQNKELCGTWARDMISVERTIDHLEYTELKCEFANE